MTIDEQLPSLLILFAVLGVGFPFFLVWLGYKATENTLKRTFPEIGQKNPKLQAYLNQGYDLLAIVRDKGLIGVRGCLHSLDSLFNNSFQCNFNKRFSRTNRSFKIFR